MAARVGQPLAGRAEPEAGAEDAEQERPVARHGRHWEGLFLRLSPRKGQCTLVGQSVWGAPNDWSEQLCGQCFEE